MVNINDNELLYLISEGSEEALEIMFKKYEPLIKAKIHKYQINSLESEDYIQEGRLALLKAIKTYDTSSQKTFNKFFDLILTNHFIDILRKNKKYDKVSLVLEEDIVDETPMKIDDLEDIDFSKLDLSDLEKKVYHLRFLENYKVSYICQKLQINEKTVYNTIQRIRKKIKKLK